MYGVSSVSSRIAKKYCILRKIEKCKEELSVFIASCCDCSRRVMERYLHSLVVWFTCCLSLLPLGGVCCSLKPCSVVLQIIALGGFSGFGFHEVVQVVFPSLGKSSHSPLGVSRFVESWVPLGCFPGPSFFALCWVSQGVSTLQFLPFSLFLYETKLSPPTRRPKKKREERTMVAP